MTTTKPAVATASGRLPWTGFDGDGHSWCQERPGKDAGAGPVLEGDVEADIGDDLGAEDEEDEAGPEYG